MNAPHPSAGLPDPLPNIAGANAWYGPDLAARCDWMHQLDPVDVAEIDAAIDHALACRIERVALTAADFPLPRLAPRLQRIRTDILHGRGVALLRGWPAGECGFERDALAFLGIGAHLGEFVSQNGKGHVLGHVANLGLNYADPTTRGYQTRAELRYHVDGGDIVGLLCMQPACSGGLSKIASSTAVWNEIAQRRPDLARELLWPFCLFALGRDRAGLQALLRDAGVPALRRSHDSALHPQCDRKGTGIRSGTAVGRAAMGGAQAGRRYRRRAGGPSGHGLSGRRHAVPEQPFRPPCPHKLQGLA